MLTLARERSTDRVCIILANKILASMKSVQYKATAAITATDFLAAECNCKAGCSNEGPSKLGEHKLICTHCMTEPVQMSQLMFRGFAEWILVCARRRLRREKAEDVLDSDTRLRLQGDIALLMKASGQQPPPLNASPTLLDMLENYAESTGRAKMSPGEPNPRDLGLFREKVKYSRPETKAETRIKGEGNKRDNSDDGGGNIRNDTDEGSSAIPNVPRGTATGKEYLAIELAQNGLSLLFGQDDKLKTTNAKPTNVVPIGLRLARYRATAARANNGRQEETMDYSAQHEPVAQMARQWKSLLDQSTRREWNKSGDAREKRAARPTIEGPAVKKRKTGKRTVMVCCVDGCTSTDRNSKLTRVKDFPPALGPNATRQKRITHRIKSFKRREYTERLGFGRSYKKRGLRICDKHPMEMVVGKVVSITNDDNEHEHIAIEPFEAPVSAGGKSFHAPPQTPSNGNGFDREIFRHALKVSNEEASLSPVTRVALAKEGLDRDKENVPVGSTTVESNEAKWRKPSVTLDNLTAKEVKRRTGFRDLKHLLEYAAVVYAGRLDDMAKTATKMTWLEELVLFYEFTWGRSNQRMQEYQREYDCSYNTLMKAISFRQRKELDCRQRWPMYASYAEDAALRDPSWNRHFDPNDGHRPVMHDTTNIPFPAPSSGDLNRALHNKYYNQCCAKAGVAVQLCCWIYGLSLVTGHSDDDRQIEDTKILQMQKEFSENDPTSDRPFLNVLDKGYHQILEAQKHGQMCCRPDEADEQFGGDKVLRTGCVAVVRSGNERGVNRSKMSWFIKRGCSDQLWDVDLLCDVWEAFTFRINFMYDKFQ